jgi:peptide chain release factor 1
VPAGDRRRHTSTITVAILDAVDAPNKIQDSDIDLRTYRGTGAGGQHRNTSDTAVEATHVPTGIKAKSEAQRSWWQNREAAVAELRRRVHDHQVSSVQSLSNTERVDQIGLGDRASHDWTWTAWRDEAVCHQTGQRYRMAKALRGRF